jgi:cupin 2 domain-containing protein
MLNREATAMTALNLTNLYADLDLRAAEEVVTILHAAPGLRVERIVSTGQASPPGFHYDQPHAEWVAVLAGSAELHFADEPAPRALAAGDSMLIEPHRRHRVERTDSPTVWLAIHFGPELEADARP